MGDPPKTAADEKYIGALLCHPDPVVTATELAAETDVTQQAAHQKLEQLESRGLVRSKKTGARSRVWWLTTQGRDRFRTQSG